MLNCDFKSRRCNSYYLPILSKLLLFSKKNFNLSLKIMSYKNQNFYYDDVLISIWEYTMFPLKKSFYAYPDFYKLIFSKWFTKRAHLEKLFVSVFDMVLSSGIIIKYFNLHYKFLKKKFKTWIMYIECYKILTKNPSVIFLKNLFGLNLKLFYSFYSQKINIFWCFIQTFYLQFNTIPKKKKRIKKWIVKKYLITGD